MIEQLLELDGMILLWIQDNLRNEILTPFFRFITRLGDSGAIWIILTFLLFVNRPTRKVGLTAATALFFALIVDNVILKNAVARTRPYEVITELHLLIARQKDFSFPSGHTGSSFAAAVVYFQTLPRKYGIAAIVLAALIGFSRLYVGVHYPSDVLAGLVIGIVLAIIAVKLYNDPKADHICKKKER